jgi:hypothetical protein
LTSLAVQSRVAASTQNQALSDTRRGPRRPPASRWRATAHGGPAVRRGSAPAGMLPAAPPGGRPRGVEPAGDHL